MRFRVLGSAVLAAVIAACGGDNRITDPKPSASLKPLAAIGTDATTGAAIETDFDDYAPGGYINLTGRGWAPNESIHLVMTEDPDTHADVVEDVVADGTGAFALRFYQVQESDLGVRFTLTGTGTASGSKVVAQFTDQRNISAITLSPASPLAPGTSVTATVQVVLNGGSGPQTWNGTKWEIRNSSNVVVASSPAPCLDTPNHTIGDADEATGNKHSESFAFTAGAAGTYTLTVSVYSTDNCAVASDATTQSVGFTVTASNSAPVLAAIGNKSVNEGSALTFTASATDTDTPAQTLTYSLVGAPAGATIDPSSGAFSWTPTDGPAQTATFTVKATDNGSPAMSDEEQITVTVNNVAPTATFNAPTSVAGGSNIALSLTSPVDPSSVDVTAGLKYAFDCGDGAGYSALSATSTASCPTSGGSGSRSVKGKIQDKDGGVTEYTASVAIDNVAPTSSGGGPYSGNEGSAINISGSGSDPDGGTVTFLWTGPSACTFGAATSASTTVTCNDNGSYTLTLTVKDDEGAETPSTASLTVNNVAPMATFNAPSSVNEGSNISLSLTSPVDPSTADVAAGLTYFFDCGTGSGYGAASSTNSTTCATTDNGSRSVKAKIQDKDGGSTEYSATITINNVAPTATFNAPSSVNEGSPFSLSLTSPVDPSSVDVSAGFQYAFDCGDGAGYSSYGSTNTASCSTSDNGTRTVHGKIKDKDNGETVYTASVTVNNVAPVITLPITLPVAPVAVGSPVVVTWNFTDPGSDTWQCKISWDQPVSYEPLFSSTGKTCTATTSSLPAGIYTVTVYVQDDDNGSDAKTATAYIVVYDPSAGFVTGGGWIDSPAGAYRADLSLTGKANFGFVSKYKKGQTAPDGNTEFQFREGNLNFKSGSYDWLVVAGARAQFKGRGTINGGGNYGFMLTAVDGQTTGGGGVDKFRMKIWYINADGSEGETVYDNQYGAGVDDALTTSIAGGSIQIQSGK